MRKHLAVAIAMLCAGGVLAPTITTALPVSASGDSFSPVAGDYQANQEIVKDGITYKVLGVYGRDQDIVESDIVSNSFDVGDVVLEVKKVDASSVSNGVVELKGIIELDGGSYGVVYRIADEALVDSGVKYVIPSGRFHMGKGALPEGTSAVVRAKSVNAYKKLFPSVDVVGYGLTYNATELSFKGGVGSDAQTLSLTVEGPVELGLNVAVSSGSSVEVKRAPDSSYTVSPVACGRSTITATLSLGGRELDVKNNTCSAEVECVKDAGEVTVEPTYTSTGTRQYHCMHCNSFMTSETVPKLGIDFEKDGVAYSQIDESSVEVVKSGQDRYTNPLYAGAAVAIPAQVEHGGSTYKVAGIAEYAFDPLGSASPKSVTIAEGIAYIKDGAFQEMEAESVSIPKSVASIGSKAFSSGTVKKLSFAERDGAELTFGDRAFDNFSTDGILELPEGTTTLGVDLFASQAGFAKVGSVKLPSTVQVANRLTFSNIDLDKVQFPEGFAEENGVFYGKGVALWPTNPDATELTLAAGTGSVADFAFSGMQNLKSVELPEGLETIGDRVFSQCPNLTSLEIPASVTEVRSDRLGGTSWLVGCSALESFSAPGLKETAYRMFDGCSSLKVVDLPSVETVAYGSFGNTSLEAIALPKVAVIEQNAFSSGQTVIFVSSVPPAIANGKLPDGVTAWYPESSKDAYESALGIEPDASGPAAAYDLVVTGKLALTTGALPADLPVKIVKSDGMTLRYASSNDAVVAVDANGKATPKAAGSAKVTVELVLGSTVLKSVEVDVTVTSSGGGGSVAPSDKTEVEHNQDGSTTTTVTKPDGSQTITHETATGTSSTVTKDEGGNVTSTEVTVSKSDAESGKVELPIGRSEPVAEADNAPAVEVKVPSTVSEKAPVQVTVPVAKEQGAEPNYGVVVYAVDAEGNETVLPKCTVDKDGNVVFGATGDVTIKVVDAAKEMPDVTDADWFAGDVVDFATARGIVNGVDTPSGKQFQGYGRTTRGMFVAMLHNLESNPEAASEDSLADVPSGAFYADAAAWALEEGVLSGVDMPDGSKQFQGESAVTREQVAVFLMRYAEHLGMDVSKRAEIGFPDASEVSGYAEDAMSWAVASGLFTGNDVTGELNPTDGAARAEVAAVLMRFINLMYA